MKTILVIAVLVTVCTVSYAAGTTDKPVYKIFRLTRNEVAIACTNGGDPTFYPKQTGQDALIISCGE
jgi:hypothetical protein